MELLEQVRKGDEAAFTQLFTRHRAVARRVALTYRCPGDPDDLVNEAFEKVFAAVRRGSGPTDAFRAYLLVTMRRLAADHSERPRDERLDDVPEAVASAAAEPQLDAEERSLVTRAFESLPDRWQAVLWHTTVEGRNPRELAPLLGVSANAVSALAYRAREQLRQAYLQAHLQTWARPQCEPHRSLLGAYVRDAQSRRDRTATQRHLDNCPPCQDLVAELNEVNSLLVRSVVPLFPAALIAKALPVAAGAAGAAGAATAAGGAGAGAAGGGGVLTAATDAGANVARRGLGGLGWMKDAGATAGGLVAATGLLVGLVGMGAYVSGDTSSEPDVAMLIDAPSTTLVPTTTGPATTPAPLVPAGGTTTTAPDAPTECNLIDVSAELDGSALAGQGDGSGAVDDLLSVDVDLPDVLASEGDGAAGVDADGNPLCDPTASDRGELSIGLDTDSAAGGTDLDLALLDLAVSVELAGGATAAELDLPELCELVDAGRKVTCAIDSLTPSSIGLLLDTAGADAGATITVTQAGRTIDVQTVDVLGQVGELADGLDGDDSGGLLGGSGTTASLPLLGPLTSP